MLKQRITFVNQVNSNNNIIHRLGDYLLELGVTPDFFREDKYSIPLDSIKLSAELPATIAKFRVQWVGDDTSVVSHVVGEPFHEPIGLKIYAAPSAHVTNSSQFMNDVSAFSSQLLGKPIEPSQMILNRKASLYAETTLESLNGVHFLINDIKDIVGDEFDVTDSLDIIVEKEMTTIKTVKRIMSDSQSLKFTPKSDRRQEIGIFVVDKDISSDDDVVLSGVRYVFEANNEANTNNKLQKTLFHTKPKHRSIPLSYTSELNDQVGLHPSIKIRFNDSDVVPYSSDLADEECKLYYYQLLSKDFFIDKYQLPQNVSMIALYGDSDLEAPAYSIDNWGIEALFELEAIQDFDFTIHSRYQLPVNNTQTDQFNTTINSPTIFYACRVGLDSQLLEKSPFNVNGESNIGGYQSYFTRDTAFYHLEKKSGQLSIPIPRGQGNEFKINIITSSVIAIAIIWLLFKSYINSPIKHNMKKNQ